MTGMKYDSVRAEAMSAPGGLGLAGPRVMWGHYGEVWPVKGWGTSRDDIFDFFKDLREMSGKCAMGPEGPLGSMKISEIYHVSLDFLSPVLFL